MNFILLNNRKIIKKYFKFFTLFLLLVFFFSCRNENLDEYLLIGKWRTQSGQLYYKYNSNYSGVYWDESDDVREEEGKKFKWYLEKTKLTHIVYMELDGTEVPDIFTITELTRSRLRFNNGYDYYIFTKID